MNHYKIIKTISATSVLIIGLILSLSLFHYLNDKRGLSSEEYDIVKWHGKDPNCLTEKARMYQHFKDIFLKKGFSLKIVLVHLGLPEQGRIYDGMFYKNKCFQYSLGTIGNNPTEYDLIVCPDKNQNAVEKAFYVSNRTLSRFFDGGKVVPQNQLDLSKWQPKAHK